MGIMINAATTPAERFSDADRRFMRRAFGLARLGAGAVSPNPMVGAVIARGGVVLGEGWHRRYGAIHAEADAVRDALAAGGQVEGATLYCTLEPCCFHAPEKHNPPCTELIINQKIARVVIANTDPHPRVSGGGIKMLRDAGISVDAGLYAGYGAELNRAFFTFQRRGRPFVHLKIAQSLDGRIAALSGDARWISGERARRMVHRLRAFYDAVLVGRGTLAADDPKLTVRMVEGRNPLRVVLDSRLSASDDAALFTDDEREKTIVVCGAKLDAAATERAERLRARGLRVVAVGGASPREGGAVQQDGGALPLGEVLATLGSLGVRSVLVEGGAAVFSSFLREGLWDRISVFVAPIILGGGVSAVSGLAPERISDALRLCNVTIRRSGDQVLIEGSREQEICLPE